MFIVTQVSPYTDGPAGVHGVLGQATTGLVELARMAGLEPGVARDVSEIAPTHFERGGVLALFTIGETPWSAEQRAAISASLAEGRLAVLGLHSATDACLGWEEYARIVGARFDGHPWTQEFGVEVVDPAHPSTAHLGPDFRWTDEVYLFRQLREDAHVLLRVAAGQLDMGAPGAKTPDCGFPLAWCFTEGSGRVFYTSLGHFPHAWENPKYMRHLSGGLSWLLDGGTEDPPAS